MFEEGFVAGAKIVQSCFSIRSFNKSIARTFAIAGELYLALSAIARQRILFGIPEVSLLRRRDQFYQVLLLDIAQEELRLNKVVARIEVTVMLQRQGIAAGLREDTQRRRHAPIQDANADSNN